MTGGWVGASLASHEGRSEVVVGAEGQLQEGSVVRYEAEAADVETGAVASRDAVEEGRVSGSTGLIGQGRLGREAAEEEAERRDDGEPSPT